MTTLTAEQRLTRAVVWLMNDPTYAAFSGLYMMGKTEVKDGIPTACTNGRDEFYGREFISTLTDQEIRGLKLHETWHKAARHLMVWKHIAKENPRLANMAMDLHGSRYITYKAAWMLAEDLECDLQVASAKGWISEAYKRISALGHQIGAATAYIVEHDMTLFSRRAKGAELAFGDAAYHRKLVARTMEL